MLRRFTIMIILLACAGLARAGEAGRIVFVAGDVRVAGQRAALNHAVNEGDELATGGGGYAYLKTVDNGFLILRPNSRARIVAYQVDRENPANTRIKLELLEGVVRSISGDEVKRARQNFRFNTPVAAIGVRGTDFTVFTDQHTTRIAVISGGIVASGFSDTCGSEGYGPCEGGASRELFAGQPGLLQVERGKVVPQLLRGSSLAPDSIAPPRGDEPVGQIGGIGAVSVADANGLEPKRNNDLLQTLAPPPMRDVLWGRWQAVANRPVDTATLDKLESGDYLATSALGPFVISRTAIPKPVFEKLGNASFALAASEAYLSVIGQEPVAASVQNARLDIDFDARAFSTSLQVVAPGAQLNVRAQGFINVKGGMISDAERSNVRLTGYVGGATAQEAGYLFQSIGTPALSAAGATHWVRPNP